MRLSGLNRTTTTVGCAALALLGGMVLGGSGAVSASPPAEPKVQNTFDPLGPDVRAAKLPSGVRPTTPTRARATAFRSST